MAWKYIADSVLTVIKSYVTGTAGKKNLEWVAKNNPTIAKAIKDGLGISDTTTIASELDKSYKRYAKAIPIAKDDAIELEHAEKKLASAKKFVSKLEKKLKGRNAQKYSLQQRKIITSDIKYAKTVVKYWEDELDDVQDNILKSANSLATHSTRVVSAYKRLSKKL